MLEYGTINFVPMEDSIKETRQVLNWVAKTNSRFIPQLVDNFMNWFEAKGVFLQQATTSTIPDKIKNVFSRIKSLDTNKFLNEVKNSVPNVAPFYPLASVLNDQYNMATYETFMDKLHNYISQENKLLLQYYHNDKVKIHKLSIHSMDSKNSIIPRKLFEESSEIAKSRSKEIENIKPSKVSIELSERIMYLEFDDKEKLKGFMESYSNSAIGKKLHFYIGRTDKNFTTTIKNHIYIEYTPERLAEMVREVNETVLQDRKTAKNPVEKIINTSKSHGEGFNYVSKIQNRNSYPGQTGLLF